MFGKTLFLLLSLTPFFTFSQVNIINRSLTDSSLRIAYIGVDNFLELKGMKISDDVKVISSQGNVTKTNTNFTLRVPFCDSIFITVQKKGRQILKEKFKCDQLYDPILQLGAIKDSVASVKEILINPFLRFFRENCFYKKQFMITNFTAVFISQELDSLNTYAVGNLLTSEQKELIKKLKTGDKTLFDQIYALGPDSRRRKLSPFTITIK